ncbi:MAG: hypothetical protein HZA90_14980 [Verrucomicrobia bacterium]|nr:hypothetical protein [Verrucomicrobiota bacterium]
MEIDRRQRSVSFPAVLNLSQGPMEYFLVTAYGKTHESILRTEAPPSDIHVVMLLLGARDCWTNDPSASRQSTVVNPTGKPVAGGKISLAVSWRAGDKAITRAAEELVFNQATGSVMASGNWVYNGSLIADGNFLAQAEGSLVSLITDPVALVNYIGPGHDNDRIWTVNTNSLPPANTPLQVTIKLEERPKK